MGATGPGAVSCSVVVVVSVTVTISSATTVLFLCIMLLDRPRPTRVVSEAQLGNAGEGNRLRNKKATNFHFLIKFIPTVVHRPFSSSSGSSLVGNLNRASSGKGKQRSKQAQDLLSSLLLGRQSLAVLHPNMSRKVTQLPSQTRCNLSSEAPASQPVSFRNVRGELIWSCARVWFLLW